jgi:hypothetical protein
MSCITISSTDGGKCSIKWNSSTTRLACITPADISPILTTEYVNVATPNDPFYVDSGTTSHCLPHHSDFLKLNPIPPCKINSTNGTLIAAIGRGKIVIKLRKGRKLTLTEALYIPQAALCLISVGHMADSGVSSLFHSTSCALMCGLKMIATGTCTGTSFYSLNDSQTHTIEHASIACTAPNLETWHKRLSHISYASII